MTEQAPSPSIEQPSSPPTDTAPPIFTSFVQKPPASHPDPAHAVSLPPRDVQVYAPRANPAFPHPVPLHAEQHIELADLQSRSFPSSTTPLYRPTDETRLPHELDDVWKVQLTVSTRLIVEIFRWTLYAFSFIFAVLMWAGTAADLYPIDDQQRRCAAFTSKHTGPDKAQHTVDESGTCVAIIAVGVLLTCVLLAVVLCHVASYCSFHVLSDRAEAIVLGVLALLWLILGTVVIAESNSVARQSVQLRRVIAGGWMAGVSHAAAAGLALFRSRRTIQAKSAG